MHFITAMNLVIINPFFLLPFPSLGPISGTHNDSSCSSSPDSPHLGNQAAGNTLPNSHHSNAHHQQQQQNQSQHHHPQHQQHSNNNNSGNSNLLLAHPHSVGSTNTGGSNQQDHGPGGEDSQASMGGAGAGASRAQYVSATCVVFTHYSGDTASVVDEHFSRALNFSNKDANKGKWE